MTDLAIPDQLDPARANALCATLGLDHHITDGDPLPPFFHQIYFWQAQPPGGLGRDGHPQVGSGLVPDLGLPRRMWAGGALSFHAPLLAGQMAEKRSTVEDVTRKTGRSGDLAFAQIRHEIVQDNRICVTENQTLVFRNDPSPDAPRPTPQQAPETEDVSQTRSFDTTLLFRYSALTFNGHRIHYDESYARQTEGYDGLVVHGPLLAQMLMLMAHEDAPLSQFEFRGASPLMHHETVTLCRTGDDLWIRAQDGRLVMKARRTSV